MVATGIVSVFAQRGFGRGLLLGFLEAIAFPVDGEDLGSMHQPIHEDLLFEVITRRYQQRVTILTTNKPLGNGTRSSPMTLACFTK
jgi:hypothetical protein